MLKKSKTGRMTCRNEHAICRFGGDTLDTGTETLVTSKEDTSKTGNNSAMKKIPLQVHTLYCPSVRILIPFMLTGFPARAMLPQSMRPRKERRDRNSQPGPLPESTRRSH